MTSTTPRIALFTDSEDFGGAEEFMIVLGEHLRPEYEPVLTSFVDPLTNKVHNPELLARAEQAGIPHIPVTHWAEFKRKSGQLAFGRAFAQNLKAHNISLLHSHLFGAILGGGVASLFARIPHVGTIHDSYTFEESPKRKRIYQLLALLGTRLCAVSHDTESRLRNGVYFPRSRLRTIHNGIRPLACDKLGERSPSEIRQRVRAELELSDDTTVFISVGRLAELKRYDLLIQAFETLSDQDASLVIVGDGPESAALQALAQKMPHAERIKFTGFSTDPAQYLLAADCFVLCSDTEGLSMSILEAMAAGLPCIVTDVGGNTELVLNGHNGVVVQRGDQSALGRELLRLHSDRALREEQGKASLERVSSLFSLRQMVARYRGLYGKLLGLGEGS